jgi:arsenite/tail-anchored protein-transporting ATPase
MTADKKVMMFSGKGGVGKTTCAAATALHYAETGYRTLALSTDPTPSLGHIFEKGRCRKLTGITPLLDIDEIGIEKVKEMWDGRFGREVYSVFSSFVDIKYDEFVDFVSSILPGLRDEFMVDYIRQLTLDTYQTIIWDTAPLGQTLGLLTMPAMMEKHMKAAPRIYTRLRAANESKKSVMDIIKGWEQLSQIDLEFLRNEVDFTVVTIPEALAVEQLDDIFAEFAGYGFTIGRLIINNVIREADSPFLQSRREQQQPYIETMRKKYGSIIISELPMFPREIKGIEKLKQIAAELFR